jgi:hypothetical protein
LRVWGLIPRNTLGRKKVKGTRIKVKGQDKQFLLPWAFYTVSEKSTPQDVGVGEELLEDVTGAR